MESGVRGLSVGRHHRIYRRGQRIRGNQHSGWGVGALRRLRRHNLLEEPVCRDVDRCHRTNSSKC